MKRGVWVLLLAGLFSARLPALVFSDRNYFLDPFQYPMTNLTGAFTRMWGWGEFGKYLYQSDYSHFWNAKLGAYGEMFRYGDIFSVVIGSDLELFSSTNSDIYFEPRAIFWQETLYFFFHYAGQTFGLGYHHRCKHDIDNLNELLRTGYYLARVSIYDSITLRWNPEPIEFDWGIGVCSIFKPYVKNHFYVIKSDITSTNYIAPYLTITNIIDTVELGAKIQAAEWQGISFYIHPAVFIDIYQKDNTLITPVDWFFEGGFMFTGAMVDFEVYFRYERFSDNGVEYDRLGGDYWLIGLKIE